MEEKVINRLKEIVGDEWVVTALEQKERYLQDETEPLLKLEPNKESVVVKPENSNEISRIMKLANEEKVPVIARGGGTGVVNGAVPIQPSIVISLERFNKIIEVDEDNLMVTCEAGVTLRDLLDRLNQVEGLFFPVHPGDEGAQIGGMVATNAGGVRAIRHGIMRNHVKGLEVVLPTGEILNLGGKLIKNVAGYETLHFMVGSEGTLGIITKVILRLYPEPKYSATLLFSFDDRKEAIKIVPQILKKGLDPLAIEYIDREMAELSAKQLGLTWPAKKGKVDIMVILSEFKENDLYDKSVAIDEIAKEFNCVDSIIAETKKDQEDILAIRSNIYEATKHLIVDALDMAVPPANIADFMEDLDSIYKKYGLSFSAYGHAGDGNIHTYVYKVNGEKPAYYEETLEEFYKAAVKYGGTMSAEHGTGKLRKKYLHLQFSDKEIELWKGIKKVFDPNGILNPGTIVDIM